MSVVTKNSKNGAEIICTVFTEDKVPKQFFCPFAFFALIRCGYRAETLWIKRGATQDLFLQNKAVTP